MNLIMDWELRQRGHFYESLLMLTNSGQSPTTHTDAAPRNREETKLYRASEGIRLSSHLSDRILVIA